MKKKGRKRGGPKLTNDLSVERSGLLGGVVLRVGADVATTDVLDGHVLDVEADVVSWLVCVVLHMSE